MNLVYFTTLMKFFLLLTLAQALSNPDLRVSTIAGIPSYVDIDSLYNIEETAWTVPYVGGNQIAVANDGTVLLEMDGRIVTPQKSGLMLILAGGGKETLESGLATHSDIDVNAIEIDNHDGTIYIADGAQDVIWSVTKSGYISRFAGMINKPGQTISGTPPLEGKLYDPRDVKVGVNGDVYILNWMSNTIFKVKKSTGLLEHVAGRYLSIDKTYYALPMCVNATDCGDGDDARLALLNVPVSMALGPAYGAGKLQDLYIVDLANRLIRRVNAASGIIETIAGTYGSYDSPITNVVDINVHPISGIVFLSAFSSFYYIDALSGNFSLVEINLDPPLYLMSSFTFDKQGNIYLIDGQIGVHLVQNNISSLIVPKSITISDAIEDSFPRSNYALKSNFEPSSLYVCPNNDIVFTDGSSEIKRISSTTGLLSLVAGNKTGYSEDSYFSEETLNDGILAISAFISPVGISCRKDGTIIFSDIKNVLRSIAINGTISTFAGTMYYSGATGDGGPAHLALLNNPTSITTTANDDYIYFCDTGNYAIRRISTITWIIETIAGVLGQGASEDDVFISGPALLTLFKFPRYLAVHENGDVFISDSGWTGIFKVSGGFMSHLAGKLGERAPASTLPPGPALDAVFFENGPGGIALSPSGNELFIADSGNHMIRKIDLLTSIISPIFGSASTIPGSFDQGYTPDGINGADTLFSYPSNLIFSPLGELFIIDQSNQVIREAVMYGPTICPAGFFCSAGRNFDPCSKSNETCPPNSKEPILVDPGFMAVALPINTDTAVYGQLYATQVPCFINSTCFRGKVTPCPSGRFGVQGRQAHPDSCSFCPLDSYLTGSGHTVATNGQSPCIRCPAGTSSWLLTGASLCPLCQPGTFRASGGGGGGNVSLSVCSPCPLGSTSLFGATKCFKLEASDSVAYTKPIFFSFQRLISVSDGNTSPSDLNIVTIKAVLPIFLAALIPYVFFVLLSKNLFSKKTHEVISNALSNLDQFALKEPEEPGAAPSFLPSKAGGACSVLAFGIVIALIVSTVIQFALSNSLLQQSLLTLTPASLESFSSLPPATATVSADDKTIEGLTSASVCGGSGFIITIGAMGPKCGAPLSVNFESGFGNFSKSIFSLNSTSGMAFHTFCCNNCLPKVLSSFSATFDASCQSLVISVAAVNAGGGISISSVHVSRDNAFESPLIESISATFPIAFEVVQDNVFGSPRSSDNLVLGGRSVSGLVVLPQSTYSSEMFDSQINDIGNVIKITAYLPIQPNYTLYLLLPVMTLLQLFSSLAAWLSLIGIGATLLFIHNKIANQFGVVTDNISNLNEQVSIANNSNFETNVSAESNDEPLEFTSQNPMVKVNVQPKRLGMVGRKFRAKFK